MFPPDGKGETSTNPGPPIWMFSAQGHPAGLNAALARMLYFPPALPPADPIFQLTVERVVQRDIATPEELYLFLGLYLMPS